LQQSDEGIDQYFGLMERAHPLNSLFLIGKGQLNRAKLDLLPCGRSPCRIGLCSAPVLRLDSGLGQQIDALSTSPWQKELTDAP
jgi:hypothetical protein